MRTVDGVDVLLEDGSVEAPLHGTHGDVHVDLLLWRQAFLDVAFEASKKERTEDLNA
jgi:hypothetical protein